MMKRRDLTFATLIALALPVAIFNGTSAIAIGTTSDAVERLLVRENDLTSELRALSKAMGKELAQVATSTNAEDAISDLTEQRRKFAELLQELQELDQDRAESNPEIELHLAGADAVWPELDRMIADAVTWGHLTHHEVLTSDAAARRLDLALASLQHAYRRAAIDLGVHSVILNAIAVAEEQRVLSQEIPKAFILMLHGINQAENRERLGIAMGDFERDMLGLLEGNPELGLVAAPTPEIRADLLRVQSTWVQLQGQLRLESSGVALDSEAISMVSNLSDALYEQLDEALSGLKAL